MSLFSKIGRGIKGAVAGFATGGKAGAIAGGLGGLNRGRGGRAPVQAVLPGIARLPTVAGAAGGALRRSLPGIGAGIGASIVLDRFGRPAEGVRRRRMNPCNTRALSRALRRIESFNKVQKRVSKALRSACPPARRATPSRCK